MPESSGSFVDTGFRRCDVMLLIPDRLQRGSSSLFLAFFVSLRKTQAFPLACSLRSLKPQGYRDTKIAKGNSSTNTAWHVCHFVYL
jgi:hypothetical protein